MFLPNDPVDRGGPDAPRLSDFASRNAAMRSFLEVVRRVVPSDASLLILGETGVGKERLARAIHAEGPRRRKPFVSVSCAAVPETLLEAEMFGHEAGAFTGAIRARRGWFELAQEGTIFLDEIGEMPPHLQAKLLQVLQERRVRRIGSEKLLPVDVRVMAATNRDLKADMKSARFRKDLYYRLGVVPLRLPPLRDRREDIAPLIGRYARHFSARSGRPTPQFSPEALRALGQYDWPGNVRELINAMERTILLAEGPGIGLPDLPGAIRETSGKRPLPAGPAEPPGPVPPPWDGFPPDWPEMPLRTLRRRAAEAAEKSYLTVLLEKTGGRVGEAARRAGISPRALFGKMRRHGLRKESFRRPPEAGAA